MKPYYFGDNERSLFGVYSPPSSAWWREHGIVFCHPYSNEYFRTYPAFTRLAGMLSKAGFPVLRFDYFGTGDSCGDDEEASIEQWRADIKRAIDELKKTSGVQTVSLVGLRLGASLIATLSDVPAAISNIVLWEPIINGADYIQVLNKVQQRKLKDTLAVQERLELVGYPLPVDFIDAVSKIDLLSVNRLPARKALLISSGNQSECDELSRHLQDINITTMEHYIPYQWNWYDTDGSMFMPVDALNTISNYLSKESA